MRLANCAFATAIALAMASGSAVAEEQLETVKNVSQPTVMSDAELDQIVGGTHVMERVFQIFLDHGIFEVGDGAAQTAASNVLATLGSKAP
jgi:phage-related protein